MGVIERVLAIPNKRTVKPLITYLTQEEMNAVLAAPDRSTWIGCRDHALLLTLYNTGARASEITGLVVNQIVFGSSTQVLLHGKGRKERTVPLWSQTGRVLRRWLQTTEANESSVVFPSNRGAALSRDGLDLLLQKAVESAAGCCPNLLKKNITPHVIRHTTAMHLLQAGVDIAVIALWLGHESIETTHAYIEADLTMKQRALAKLTPAQTRTGRFRANDELLDFLSRL